MQPSAFQYSNCHPNFCHSLHQVILTECIVILTTWLSILTVLFVNNDTRTFHSDGTDMFLDIQVDLKKIEYGKTKVTFFSCIKFQNVKLSYILDSLQKCFCCNYDIVKNKYLKILDYLHLSFNKWPSIQYKFWVSLVIWNHNNGEDCRLGNGPEDDHWPPSTKRVSHRGSLQKGVAVQGVLYQSILNAKLIGSKKCAQATGMTANLRILSRKADSNTWESFTRSELKLSQCITSEISYLGCGEKELDCCSVVQSPLFRWKYILHFIWKSMSQSLEEQLRGTESMLLEVQCEVSTVSDDLGCNVICWCWSTVFSEVHS